MDFITANMNGHVYEGLTRIGHSLQLEPNLAVSWRLLEPTVWEFKLRPDVRFHDGTPLTSVDVVFSLDRGRSEKGYSQAMLEAVTRIEAVDALTVRATTRSTDPVLPTRLWFTGIMSAAWAKQHGVPPPAAIRDARDSFSSEHANGTGPFRLVESEALRRAVLERNPDWWGLRQAPIGVDRIEWLRFEGDEARWQALLDGRIDMIWRPPLYKVDQVTSASGLQWVKGPSPRVWFVQVNIGRPELRTSDVKGRNPFADKRVREAMYRGMDIDRLVRTWFAGHGIPRGVIMAPFIHGWSPELDHRPAHDPSKAKALLAEAGYPNGFSVQMTTSDPPWPIDRLIADGLSEIGIRVGFEGVDDLKWQQMVDAGEIDMSPDTAPAWLFDAGQILKDRYYSRANHVGYANTRLDELIEKADTELATFVREDYLAAAWRIAIDDLVYIPLFQEVHGWVTRDFLEMPIDYRVVPDFRIARFTKSRAH
jgi:peptide/nickel transport system substrate-binding protein